MNTEAKRKMIKEMIFTGCPNGQTFTATFTKKDGTIRDMNCRLGVTKHLKGGESTTAHKENLMTVFDMQTKEYRCINLDTVQRLRIAGSDISWN